MVKDYNILTRYDNCKRNGHSLKEYFNIKCVKYEEKSYIVRNCASEKINWLEDTIEPLQILKKLIKKPKIIKSVVLLKWAMFRHLVE